MEWGVADGHPAITAVPRPGNWQSEAFDSSGRRGPYTVDETTKFHIEVGGSNPADNHALKDQSVTVVTMQTPASGPVVPEQDPMHPDTSYRCDANEFVGHMSLESSCGARVTQIHYETPRADRTCLIAPDNKEFCVTNDQKTPLEGRVVDGTWKMRVVRTGGDCEARKLMLDLDCSELARRTK